MLQRSTDEHVSGGSENGNLKGHEQDDVCRTNGGDGSTEMLEEEDDACAFESSVPCHPLGIKPLGNQYFSTTANARDHVGTLQLLPDETLLLLLEHLDPQSLRRLGYTSRFLHAFCTSDELWKPLLLKSRGEVPQPCEWLGSWRSSLLGLPEQSRAHIGCDDVFSDVLHRPFVCSNITLSKYAFGIPEANKIRRFPDLSYAEFEEKWSGTPFILTEVVTTWPVSRQWTMEKLVEDYRDASFRAEAVDWPFATYSQYMSNTQDESPLYLFDKRFAEKMRLKIGKAERALYWKPDCFGPDLFEVLGPERPAHRWLIIGPSRSGSTFHKDPNATSAWNAVIQGAKYWIMFPPSVQVPGVYVSKDSSEVTSPLSIAEWLLEFHAEARATPGAVEGICKAGEVLHVPSGWWHLVVNLDAGVALTQNFVPKSHLSDVIGFLRDRPDQVTGFRRDIDNPFALFKQRLQAEHPELLQKALDDLDSQSRKKRKWEAVIGGASGEDNERGVGGGGFTFGFGGGDDDEIP
ncbi:hypothetical protein RB596_001148 [Gaeumannomyces avenae]